jgi:hypothetical protein
VLLAPDTTQGYKAIKLTLMWLIARRIVEVRTKTTRGVLGTARRRSTVHVIRPLPDDLPGYVLRLIGLIETVPEQRVDKIASVLGTPYGVNGRKLVRDEIVGLLVEKRLVERYPGRLLGLFPIERRRRTPEGDALARRVEGTLASARTIPALLDRDPRQAAALAFAAGGLIFLVPELLPELSAIAAATRRQDASSGGDGGPAVTTSADGDHDGMTWAPLDLSEIEALDGALESFGSDFDSGSGDGGDGGGDGGGGGGD